MTNVIARAVQSEQVQVMSQQNKGMQ